MRRPTVTFQIHQSTSRNLQNVLPIHQELDAVLNYDLVSHDDSSSWPWRSSVVSAVNVVTGMSRVVWPSWAICTSFGVGGAGALGHSRDSWSDTMYLRRLHVLIQNRSLERTVATLLLSGYSENWGIADSGDQWRVGSGVHAVDIRIP